MTTLTYQNFYNDMGLVAEPLIANPAWIWAFKAWVGMGTRLHGDGLTAGWKSAAQPGGAGGPSNPNYTALTTTPWEDVTGWFGAVPSINNTCTNAAVRVWDFQMQYFDITSNTWKIMGTGTYRNREATISNVNWWSTDTFTSEGAATRYYSGRYNGPLFSCTKLDADMAAPDSFPNTATKYRFLHNALPRATVDYSKIGGIAIMCKAKLVAVPGTGALNGDPHIFCQVGGDYWPRAGLLAGSGVLTGISNMPAIGSGTFKKLTTSEQVFLFTPADINPDTYVDTTSVYSSGTKNHLMTAALFQANVPQFLSF